MSWYRDFGLTEQIFCAAFGLFYLLYFIRMLRIARSLHTPVYTLLFKFSLRSLVFALLLLAILGPSFGDTQREVKSIGKDIMICVDLSKSMDAIDIAPTRLEKVKYEMKKLVAAFNSDRIGIIIFSSEAFMQSPLTYDQAALNLFIDAMSTELVPASGTDFGPPLRMAYHKLEEADQEASLQNKSKVIILISDGEDFGDASGDEVREIEKRGIKLFTLGVGTEEGGRIMGAKGYKKDREGNTVVSKLNTKELKSLASRTGGQYFEISGARNDSERLESAIRRIEGELRDTRHIDVTANRYYYFLAAALGLFMLDALFNIKTLAI